MHEESTPHAGHERENIPLRPIVAFAVVLVLISAAAGLFTQWLFGAFARRASLRDAPLHPLAIEGELPPAPRLQANPAAELERVRAQERAIAETYGWVDRDAGIVRVPLERAFELVLERGLPAREEGRR